MTTLMAASASSDAAPGTLAFLIIFGMAVVLFFLFRSMTKHLRKVNEAARRNETTADDQAAQDRAAGDMTSASSPDRRTEP